MVRVYLALCTFVKGLNKCASKFEQVQDLLCIGYRRKVFNSKRPLQYPL